MHNLSLFVDADTAIAYDTVTLIIANNAVV